MGNYRIMKNTVSGRFKIQVPYMIFWWSTLQESLNGRFDCMIDKVFDSYEEAEESAERYCKKSYNGKWVACTQDYTGVYQGGDSEGKRGSPPVW